MKEKRREKIKRCIGGAIFLISWSSLNVKHDNREGEYLEGRAKRLGS